MEEPSNQISVNSITHLASAEEKINALINYIQQLESRVVGLTKALELTSKNHLASVEYNNITNNSIAMLIEKTESISEHLGYHDQHLESHDKSLEVLGDHLAIHDEHLDTLGKHLDSL